ncbi:MAG: tetratricopeptide repeat protein [Bacteroidia bacterium]|nr:tetratricopeptide repeat protein [Bacteroidia bacterium]
MNVVKIIFVGLITLLHCNIALAQAERSLARNGNKLYNDKAYSEAELKYKEALQKNANLKQAGYNLGNALYRQKKYDEAIKQYTDITASKELLKSEKAQAWHNLGNAYLEQKKYEESIKAYKNALKLNPADEDTRYNLAYAQAKLKKEQEEEKKQKQRGKEKGKEKEQKEKQKGKEEDKQEMPGDEQKDKEKQSQPQRQKISKEDAEKILKALNNDEKELQKNIKKGDAKRVNIEKNW